MRLPARQLVADRCLDACGLIERLCLGTACDLALVIAPQPDEGLGELVASGRRRDRASMLKRRTRSPISRPVGRVRENVGDRFQDWILPRWLGCDHVRSPALCNNEQEPTRHSLTAYFLPLTDIPPCRSSTTSPFNGRLRLSCLQATNVHHS